MKPVLWSAILFLISASVFAKNPNVKIPESYELDQSAIVQTGKHPRVYYTRAFGELEAADVATGKSLWHTKKAAVPLLARGAMLLVQLPAVNGKTGCSLAILDAWSGEILKKVAEPDGKPIGCVGEGINGSFHLSAFTKDGHDYLVYVNKWWPTPGGAYMPDRKYAPGSFGETRGAFEVDWDNAKLISFPGDIPDGSPKFTQNPKGGYYSEPFEVGKVKVQTSMEMKGNQYQLILRRWKGEETLPELKLADPPWNSCGIVISADQRNVLGVFQIPNKIDPFLYDVNIYSTENGKKISHLAAKSWPARAQLCGSKLVAYFPWRVFVLDIASGKEVWTKNVKDFTYRGPYPPAARPPISAQPEKPGDK